MPTRTPPPLRRRRRKHAQMLALEPFERRVLLAGGNSTFAVLSGVSSASSSANASVVHIAPDEFVLPQRRVLLEMTATAEGTDLDPGRIRVLPSGRNQRRVILQRPDAADHRSSLTLAAVRPGNDVLSVKGQGGSTGSYALHVALAGDANSDYQVDATDLRLIRSRLGAHSGDPHYLDGADVDGNGVVGVKDWYLTRFNLGAATTVRPLTVSMGLDGFPDQGGYVVVDRSDLTVVGHTEPFASVSLDQQADGTFEQMTTADAAGVYRFQLTPRSG